MKIYLVGGAIRDKLLGEKIKERDFVVVGSTPEEMLNLGFKQVGRDFPVFLHPKTHEEYALARTEKKTGTGYTEFNCESNPDVTLEEDLLRRDLTVNAIAEDEDGNLIDPYGGLKDIEAKILRHVSEAFAEDPLRVLRVARFAARFPEFSVHPDTIQLMRKIVATPGEINALVTERVWQECQRALSAKAPWRFFDILQKSDASKILFPELEEYLADALERLTIASRLSMDPIVRWAALGIGLTEDAAKDMHKRIKPPRLFRELLILAVRTKVDSDNALDLNSEQLLHILNRCDAFRKPKRFFSMLLALETTKEEIPSQQFNFLRQVYRAANQVDVKDLVAQNLSGDEFKKRLTELRIQKINMLGVRDKG